MNKQGDTKNLFDNNIALLTSEKNSSLKDKLKKIRKRYLTTLYFVDNLCRKNNISYLVFKTYRYINEINDGDLDLILRKNDFEKFIALFESPFRVVITEDHKACIYHPNFINIEPRVNIDFHGVKLMENDFVFRHSCKVKEGIINIKIPHKEIEAAYFIMGLFYAPNGWKKYHHFVFSNIEFKKMLKFIPIKYASILESIKNEIDHVDIDQKMPFFISNFLFLKIWFISYVFEEQIPSFYKFKHLVFFFYLKYRFLWFDSYLYSHYE